jgi:succinate-semialdehyde dehydrogenase/glutarate-semialdehyde dehydrogenase
MSGGILHGESAHWWLWPDGRRLDHRTASTFVPKLVEAVRAAKFGDPADSTVVVGLMISRDSAERATRRITEAVGPGARIFIGGKLGSLFSPTVLDNLDKGMRAAVMEVSATSFGLAAGMFPFNLSAAFRAARTMRFDGVHINEASSARVASFGGVEIT